MGAENNACMSSRLGRAQAPPRKKDDMDKIIGKTTTYHGDEHRYLRGHEVRIVAVFKGALRRDYHPDADTSGALMDDEDIRRAGGVTADDRVEAQPWIEKEGRFSFVSSDPRAIDLDCFKALR